MHIRLEQGETGGTHLACTHTASALRAAHQRHVSTPNPPDRQEPELSEHAEVVRIARDLIRLDTSNYGDSSGPGERLAAEYVAAELGSVGIESTIFESEKGRTSLVARVAGADSSRGALCIHGHLDVVPAAAGDWQVDPFAGEIKDDYLWGRGAVDMKNMCAMTIASVIDMVREGRVPPRDLVIAMVADEEAGGHLGAQYLVEKKPELLEGVTEAIGEVSFSLMAGDKRVYLIETAQKGLHWMRLTAQGTAGHGSMVNHDNAVTRLCDAVSRLGNYDWPIVVTPTVREFLAGMSDALGVELDPDDMETTLAKLGPVARIVGATLQNTINPSVLNAGYKTNVVPGTAVAEFDGRFLAGQDEAFMDKVRELVGDGIELETVSHGISTFTTFDGELVDAMTAAVQVEEPDARTVPYMLSAGTDAKHLSTLDIRCFGFVPIPLPADLDFTALFHGVDERIPLESLVTGQRILDRFLMSS